MSLAMYASEFNNNDSNPIQKKKRKNEKKNLKKERF
jgi:hypothetical protein